VQATFDLTGVQPGVYSLVLSQGSNTPVTLPNIFTVDQGGATDIRISIAGFSLLREGFQETYDVIVTNLGNIDSGKIRIWVSFPDVVQWQPLPAQPNSSGSMNGYSYLAFDVSPTLSGSTSISLSLSAPLDTNLTHRPFQIQAWEQLP
jgi:hypothetical protein